MLWNSGPVLLIHTLLKKLKTIKSFRQRFYSRVKKYKSELNNSFTSWRILQLADLLIGASFDPVPKINVNKSGLSFDFLEGEVDMEIESGICLCDEELSGGIYVSNSINKWVQVLAYESFVVFFEGKLKLKGFFDMNTDLDYSE